MRSKISYLLIIFVLFGSRFRSAYAHECDKRITKVAKALADADAQTGQGEVRDVSIESETKDGVLNYVVLTGVPDGEGATGYQIVVNYQKYGKQMSCTVHQIAIKN